MKKSDLGIKNWVTGSTPKGQPRTEKKRGRTMSKGRQKVSRTSRLNGKASNPILDAVVPSLEKARKNASEKGDILSAAGLGALQFYIENPKESRKFWREINR